jgi:hypothetical protein
MWSSAIRHSESSELQLIISEDALSSATSANRMPTRRLRMDRDNRIPPTNPKEVDRADVSASYPLLWALLRDEGLPFEFRTTNSPTLHRHPVPSGKGFDLLRAITFKEPIHAPRNTYHHPDRSGWPRTVI